MEGGPPCFPPGFTCPAVLWILLAKLSFRLRGSYPLWLAFPRDSTNLIEYHIQSTTPEVRRPPVCPLPISLATTLGISFDFSSSAYLDVSVQRVYPYIPMYSVCSNWILLQPGFPIRKSTNQRLFAPTRSLSQLTTSFIGS